MGAVNERRVDNITVYLLICMVVMVHCTVCMFNSLLYITSSRLTRSGRQAKRYSEKKTQHSLQIKYDGCFRHLCRLAMDVVEAEQREFEWLVTTTYSWLIGCRRENMVLTSGDGARPAGIEAKSTAYSSSSFFTPNGSKA